MINLHESMVLGRVPKLCLAHFSLFIMCIISHFIFFMMHTFPTLYNTHFLPFQFFLKHTFSHITIIVHTFSSSNFFIMNTISFFTLELSSFSHFNILERRHFYICYKSTCSLKAIHIHDLYHLSRLCNVHYLNGR